MMDDLSDKEPDDRGEGDIFGDSTGANVVVVSERGSEPDMRGTRGVKDVAVDVLAGPWDDSRDRVPELVDAFADG